MKYRVYGVVLESDERLPELEEFRDEPNGCASISVQNSTQCRAPGAAVPPSSEVMANDWPATARVDRGYLLQFGDEATFWVDAGGRSIHCYPGSAARETRAHLLLDHVVPRTLSLLGMDPIHATAVAREERVLVFLGKTGIGKSSLAAALGVHGCELVADDCLVLRAEAGAIVATPGYAGLRLYPDTRAAVCPAASASQLAGYTEKKRVTGHVSLAARALPVSAIYALQSPGNGDSSVRLAPMRASESVVTLTSHSFHMDLEQRKPLLRQLRFFAHVAGTVPIKKCHVPANLAALVRFGREVLDDALGA